VKTNIIAGVDTLYDRPSSGTGVFCVGYVMDHLHVSPSYRTETKLQTISQFTNHEGPN
jgi:hypothetical protein